MANGCIYFLFFYCVYFHFCFFVHVWLRKVFDLFHAALLINFTLHYKMFNITNTLAIDNFPNARD